MIISHSLQDVIDAHTEQLEQVATEHKQALLEISTMGTCMDVVRATQSPKPTLVHRLVQHFAHRAHNQYDPHSPELARPTEDDIVIIDAAYRVLDEEC